MSETCGCCGPSSDTELIAVQVSVEMPVVAHCPRCGERGRKVDGATVKAMLSVSLREVRDGQYFFCRGGACPVVYFHESGQTFTTDQVRERVYQKEPDAGDVHVCYCFDHTPDSIRAELLSTGQSTATDAIQAGITAGQCACDLRNPQGSCCLGNVKVLVKAIRSELAAEA